MEKKKTVKPGRIQNRNLAQSKWAPLGFLLPGLIAVIFAVAYPILYEIKISFQNVSITNVISGIYPWIGLDNYIEIITDPLFYTTFLRTIIWTVVNVSAHVFFGVSLALLLHRKLPGKNLIRTLLILPWAVPQYIAVLTWRNMYNTEYGAVNIILSKLLGQTVSIPWMSDPKWTFIAAIITNIWSGIPFMMMISYGGLQGISEELYEAAEIDGASSFQKLRNITIPLLKPIMTPAIVWGTIVTFNMLNVLVIFTNNTSAEDTQILVSLVYKRAFEGYKFGYSAAFSLIIFLILLCFSSVYIKTQKLED